jgi:hypothetical protein
MTNKEKAELLRSAASALEHGRHATARTKVKAVWNDYLLNTDDPETHPDTDEHRAGCSFCMMVHDKNLPNYGE